MWICICIHLYECICINNQKKKGHKSDGALTGIEGVPDEDCVAKII